MAIRQYEELTAAVRGVQDAAKKALGSTVKDMKARAPGWIATAVTKRYAIKKGEVTPKSKNAKRPQVKAGNIKVTGETIETLTFTYEGRLLTPTHFGMKPKQRTRSVQDESGRTVKKAKPYQVSAEIIRGERKNMGAQVFLASSGGAGSTEIPFQRKGKGRTPLVAVKTVSVPQMVGEESVEAEFRESLNKGLMERLQHHMDRQGLG